MAEAKDARSGADVMVVQWLRFGSGGFMQMIGVGRRRHVDERFVAATNGSR